VTTLPGLLVTDTVVELLQTIRPTSMSTSFELQATLLNSAISRHRTIICERLLNEKLLILRINLHYTCEHKEKSCKSVSITKLVLLISLLNFDTRIKILILHLTRLKKYLQASLLHFDPRKKRLICFINSTDCNILTLRPFVLPNVTQIDKKKNYFIKFRFNNFNLND